MNLLSFLCGSLLIVWGTYQLTRGVSHSLANSGHGASVISSSLFVIGIGLSAPILIISAHAAKNSHSQLALGTAIGAVTISIFLTLGLSAIRNPIALHSKRAKLLLLTNAAFSGILYFFASDLTLTRDEGLVLIGLGCISEVVFFFRSPTPNDDQDLSSKPIFRLSFFSHVKWLPSVMGAGILIAGVVVFLPVVESVSVNLGLEEMVFGATIVALVCSITLLLFLQVLSTIRQYDYMQNILYRWCAFNLSIVVGIVAVFSPEGIILSKSSANFVFLSMVGGSTFGLPMLLPGLSLRRVVGLFSLATAIAYLAFSCVQIWFPESASTYSTACLYTFLFLGFGYFTSAFRDALG